MSSAIRCNMDVGSLKLTGNEILVRSLPMLFLRIAHNETEGRSSLPMGILVRRCLYVSMACLTRSSIIVASNFSAICWGWLRAGSRAFPP